MGNIVNLSHLLEFYLGGAGVRLYRVPNNWCSQLGGTPPHWCGNCFVWSLLRTICIYLYLTPIEYSSLWCGPTNLQWWNEAKISSISLSISEHFLHVSRQTVEKAQQLWVSFQSWSKQWVLSDEWGKPLVLRWGLRRSEIAESPCVSEIILLSPTLPWGLL